MIIEICGIRNNELCMVWSDVKKWVHKSLKLNRTLSIDDIYEGIESREMQLWIIQRNGEKIAAGVTGISNYPSCKILTVFALGGTEMDKWLEICETNLVKFALENGCKYLEMLGRKGWSKKLKKYGWEGHQINLTKKIGLET